MDYSLYVYGKKKEKRKKNLYKFIVKGVKTIKN